MADLVFDYNIKKVARIFEEDFELKKVLLEYRLYIPDIYIDEKNPLRITLYENLATLFLSEHRFISERGIDDLWFLRFRVSRINQIFDETDIVDYKLYKQLIFSYKYSTIKHFFEDNFTKFLPTLDASVIQNNEKMQLFQVAFMKEYDRFADIIDNIYQITDVDNVSNQYLPYLVQLLGYEKGDDGGLLDDNAFRELAKNIIEIYRVKGTNYSFELFFNFLGFSVELDEFWFDKRFGDPGISMNPFTLATNPEHFAYYLTPKKPTTYIPDNMINPYQVDDNMLTDIRSHLWFERKIFEGHSIAKLLGEDSLDPPEPGFDYSFFKTNVIQYVIRRIRSKDTDPDELSEEDEKIIQMYADFLTPIFVHKRVAITVTPFEDVAEGLHPVDRSLWNPITRTIDNMFKIHKEKFLIDDWVRDPLEPWKEEGRAPLVFTELTDVETPTDGSEDRAISREEPREYYLYIKTYNHNAPDNFLTKNNMTNIYDNDLFPSNSFFRVEVKKMNEAQDRDTEDGEQIVSLWDLAYSTINLDFHYLVQINKGNNPDGDEELNKITDFIEDMHNRVHRLEELNIFNRDYYDWDDFQSIRNLPTLIDSAEQGMWLNQFKEIETGDESTTMHENNDDTAAHAPWLFYDSLITKERRINFMGFGFASFWFEAPVKIEIEREGNGIITISGTACDDKEVMFIPIAFIRIKISGEASYSVDV